MMHYRNGSCLQPDHTTPTPWPSFGGSLTKVTVGFSLEAYAVIFPWWETFIVL